MKYCGIDLHSNNSVVSVIDEAAATCARFATPSRFQIGVSLPGY
jgi:hypothetical protein